MRNLYPARPFDPPQGTTPHPGLDTAFLTAAAYAATLGLLGIYGFHRVSMLARFRWRRNLSQAIASEPLPELTVQLPVYNERTVAARLIRSIGRLEYPR